jgi:hypothetical protein
MFSVYLHYHITLAQHTCLPGAVAATISGEWGSNEELIVEINQYDIVY